MKTLAVVSLFTVMFLGGMLARQVQVSRAWEVHQITGVSLYQIVTGR